MRQLMDLRARLVRHDDPEAFEVVKQGAGPFGRVGVLVLLAAFILEGNFHLRAVGLDTSVLDLLTSL